MPEKNTVKLSRKVDFGNKVLFVDGLTRAGKSMLGPICSSFENIEIERVEEFIEYIGTLYRLEKIKEDAAIAYLKQKTDMCLYNSMIGRDTNFRKNDHSSVWRSSKSDVYNERLYRDEGPGVIKDIVKDDIVFQNQTHDQLMNYELYNKAFGSRLYIIEMIRHPVDLLDSWIRRGWGNRFGSDPLAFTFTIEYGGIDLPYYASGWEAEYLESSEETRALLMINNLWNSCFSVYEKLSNRQKENILIIPFEQFIQFPSRYIAAIAKLVEKKSTDATAKALINERCPREYSLSGHLARKNYLFDVLPPERHGLLHELIESYEKMCEKHSLLTDINHQ